MVGAYATENQKKEVQIKRTRNNVSDIHVTRN